MLLAFKEHSGSIFAHVYHHLIDSYLLNDREAKTSIKYFTLPSITTHVRLRK